MLFISDNLHSRGTTVWEGVLLEPLVGSIGRGGKQKKPKLGAGQGETVIVKDSWIDPLQKYTKGMILSMLNMKCVEGVPTLVHKQQVETCHPHSCSNKIMMVNSSMHILHSAVTHHFYYLCVLSRIITTPIGVSITEFSCLGELLVAFLDYIVG